MPASPSPTHNVVDFSRYPQSTPKSAKTAGTWPVEQARRNVWRRLESLAVFVGTLWLYSEYGAGWLAFALLFPLPDLSLAVSLMSRRAVVPAYNVAHSYALGVGLALAGLHSANTLFLALAPVLPLPHHCEDIRFPDAICGPIREPVLTLQPDKARFEVG